MRKFLVVGICFLFHSFYLNGQTPIDVAERSFKISGLSEEVFYYGLAEGDLLNFNFQEMNGKELKEIEIIELPSTSKFMDYKSVKIENKTLHIQNTGIYKFRFSNSAMGGRVCKVKIQRTPANDSNRSFNTNVYWKTVYDTLFKTVSEKYLVKREFKPVALVPTSEFYINSGANANFQGGKSRITIPVILPKGTQEWYYVFSASRDKEDIERVKNSLSLFGQISKLIDNSGTLNFGVDVLTKPPGGNVCDIYLMDYENSRLFEAKSAYQYLLIGTRENLKSGIVKISSTNNQQPYYIGIKNPDSLYGIQVLIEVVAVVLEEEWGVRDVEKNTVTSRQIPFLQN